MLEAGFANPLIFWEVLEDAKAREGARKSSSRVLLDGIRGPAGDGLQERGLTLGDHEGISQSSRRKL